LNDWASAGEAEINPKTAAITAIFDFVTMILLLLSAQQMSSAFAVPTRYVATPLNLAFDL
jgi:hypothetical protein